MLSHIHIRDFVIVDELELELHGGMSALTGETGAGKSILVDALGLALGDRADSDVVRHGQDRAEISVDFEISSHDRLQQWLAERDLDADGECQLRRVIPRDGRSRGYINGRTVPVQHLRELGELLVDIHGQHEHQSLLRRDTQRDLLDGYGGHLGLARELADTFGQWKALQQQLQELRDAAGDRAQRLDLLRFQAEELERLDAGADELEQLHDEHGRLAHAGRLLQGSQQALEELHEQEDSVQSRLSRIHAELEALVELDPALTPTQELIASALIQLDEGVDELRRYADRLELDPERLSWLDERISDIQQMARKHRVEAAELPALAERIGQELDKLGHIEEHFDSLEQQIQTARNGYDRLAAKLSKARKAAARRMGKAITEAMQELGMPGGCLEIALDPMPDGEPGTHGKERIEFLVSANPGQPPQALAKVASGGELSRISLAIQVIAHADAHTPSMVFDEVDTGIGGGVAEVVGRRLRELGGQAQVLCVTHLPQVAAQAHQHLQVSKLSTDSSTRTRIRPLDSEERIDEIARMLGGIEITDSTRAHAAEMIGRVSTPKARKRNTRKSGGK